ncbi:MAG TPA: MBL fold metallo-hydrolase [Planctomycetota bacterium]
MLPKIPLAWLAALSSLAGPVLAQDPAGAPSQAARPEPKVLGVDVTYMANAGFFFESGRYSVLIDAFLREETDMFAALPEQVNKDLVNARPPFDGLTLVFVSHVHPDHVQMRGLEKFLTNNPQAQLVSGPDVIQALRDGARDLEAIQRRMTPVRTARGAMTQAVQEEMSIEFFELEHSGKAYADVRNVAHLVEIGGVRLLHVGDAEPTLENYKPYDLKSRRIDVVFVPYWYFGKPEGVQVLKEHIQARTVVACHVPPREWEELNEFLKSNFPDVILFKDTLEKRHFLPAGEEPAEPPRPAGG